MSWLVLGWFLTFGYMPENMQLDSMTVMRGGDARVTNYFSEDPLFTAEIGIEAVAFGRVRAWGSAKTFSVHYSGASFVPQRTDFFAGLSLLFGDLEAGISHQCGHTFIMEGRPAEGVTSDKTEIFVKVSGRTRL